MGRSALTNGVTVVVTAIVGRLGRRRAVVVLVVVVAVVIAGLVARGLGRHPHPARASTSAHAWSSWSSCLVSVVSSVSVVSWVSVVSDVSVVSEVSGGLRRLGRDVVTVAVVSFDDQPGSPADEAGRVSASAPMTALTIEEGADEQGARGTDDAGSIHAVVSPGRHRSFDRLLSWLRQAPRKRFQAVAAASSRTTSSGPKPAASTSAAILSASPTSTIPARSRWRWARAAVRTSSRADRLDPVPVACQLVVGQAVDDEPGDRSDDRPGRLEAEREDADEEVAGGPQLGVGHASRRASARARVSISRMAGTVTSVFTAARAANGPAARRRSNPAPAPYV